MIITREVEVRRTPRLKILEGLFDLPPATTSRRQWSLPIETLDAPVLGDWRVGLITGPSGCGKSVVARELLEAAGGSLLGGKDEHGVERPPFEWPTDKSVVDGFARTFDVPAITGLLCSVGFSSPPDWRKPFGRLSNGQQFRVNLARALAEAVIAREVGDETVRWCRGETARVAAPAPAPTRTINPQPPTPLGYDEFGSTVHQQVRQIASAAVASAVRRYGLRFVAVTCHEDVAPWLEADWVMVVDADDVQLHVYRDGARPEPALPSVKLLPRGSLCRPDIHLRVQRCDASAWRIFRRHHYLSAELARTALCWIGMVRCGGGAGRNEPESAGGLNLAGGLNTADPGRAMACLLEAGYRPAAFTAVLPFPHPTRPGWREHRTVCLPEFQGVGIGNAMSELIASIYKRTGRPYFSTTSHPAMIAHRRKSPLWKMVRKPCLKDGHKGAKGRMPGSGDFSAGIDRLTAGFEFVGPAVAAKAPASSAASAPTSERAACTRTRQPS